MFAEHSIAFSCSCDSISKDSGVDAWEKIADKWLHYRIEDVDVIDGLVEDLVHLEVGFSCFWVSYGE